jgi:ribosomal protein S18 acetylase RimI-like enzyme
MIYIREFSKEDGFEDLIALSKDFFQEYEAHHEDFFEIDQLNDADIVDYFSRFLDNENAKAFVALAEDRILGYITVHVREQASYWKVKKVGDISGLMVRKDHRRRGIASQLLAHARAFFAEHEVRYFTLFTAVNNQAAIAFYERNGLTHLHTTMLGESENFKV